TGRRIGDVKIPRLVERHAVSAGAAEINIAEGVLLGDETGRVRSDLKTRSCGRGCVSAAIGRTGSEAYGRRGRERQVAVGCVHRGVSDSLRHLVNRGKLNLAFGVGCARD